MMEMQFEWDKEKAAHNLAKHGVSFDDASTVLGTRSLARYWTLGIRWRNIGS